MLKLTRRLLITMTAVLLGLTGLTACGGQPDPAEESAASEANTPDPIQPQSEDSPTALSGEQEAGSTLIVYFSVPETSDPEGMTEEEENSTHVVDGQVLGNTQYVAQLIEETTGAGVFRVETAEELPLDHESLVDQARQEQGSNARPELKSLVSNLESYDTIFVGYPIWWSDLPMVMYTFFEQHDLGGKTIIPFSTHGGSNLAGTVESIQELAPDSTVVTDAFTISRNDMDDADTEVAAWLGNLGY